MQIENIPHTKLSELDTRLLKKRFHRDWRYEEFDHRHRLSRVADRVGLELNRRIGVTLNVY